MYPFKDGDVTPQTPDTWWALLMSRETRCFRDGFLAIRLSCTAKEDRTAVAVGGRCPHHYFPFGESLRVGEPIQCGYHGITFGPDGLCTRVPTQTSFPASTRFRPAGFGLGSLWRERLHAAVPRFR